MGVAIILMRGGIYTKGAGIIFEQGAYMINVVCTFLLDGVIRVMHASLFVMDAVINKNPLGSLSI